MNGWRDGDHRWMVLRVAAQSRSAHEPHKPLFEPFQGTPYSLRPSARSGRLRGTQRKIVANQIDLICALQLISAEGPLAAQIGGSARGGWPGCGHRRRGRRRAGKTGREEPGCVSGQGCQSLPGCALSLSSLAVAARPWRAVVAASLVRGMPRGPRPWRQRRRRRLRGVTTRKALRS